MKSESLALVAALLVAGMVGSGCHWVPLTPEGEQVRLLPRDLTAACEEIGHTSSHTRTSVVIFARRQATVDEELTSLARNEAARMNGNAISALGPPDGGDQSFGVYRCPGG